jgi:hypothetical protein
LNNALPLLFTLAGVAEGEPPSGHEAPSNIGFLDAFISDTLMRLTLFLPFFILMAFAVWRSGVWERRVIREELAEEVGHTVTPGEYQEIVGDRMLRTRRIDRIQRRASAALINAQHELAFRKRRVRTDGKDPELDSLVAGWRDEIRRLRGPSRRATGWNSSHAGHRDCACCCDPGRGECRCVAANPFRLLPSRRLRVHAELLSFAVLHACRRDARGRRELTNKPSRMLQAGIANSGTFRHYHGEKGCGRAIDQVHLSV